MATTTLAMSTWQYTVNGGGWQQGSGHDVSIGVDGSGTIYRGYVSFSLANFSASYLIQGGSLYFKRGDSYGTKKWAIGLTDTKPAQNFTTSAFKHTVSSSYSSASGSENTISLTAAQLSAYVGKTVYILFLAATSGNTYGEIETDAGSTDQRPKLTVNYNYAKSTISSASNGTFGSQQTITVSRQDSAYTHTLTATCAGRTETIATKSSATSFNWTPTVANFAPLITTAMSASCTYTLTTYYDNTSVGTDSKSVTMTLPSASVAPSLSLAVTDNNGYASHFGGKYIVGKSAFKVTATPSFKYSATQSSLSITANETTYSSSPAVTGVVKSGQTSISASVKDSRSQTASASKTVTLLAYSAPNLSVNVQRCDQDGTENSSGAYCKVTSTYSITSLDNINSKSLTVKYKKRSDTSYTSDDRGITAYTGTDIFIFAADTDSSYNIQVVLGDYFSSTTANRTVSTVAVVFDLYNDGTGMAFGKVAEQAGLDIAWRSYFRMAPRFYANGLWVDVNDVVRTRIDRTTDNYSNGIWLYDATGQHRIYLSSSDGNIRNYDSSGQERVGLYPAEGQLALYNANGGKIVEIRADGTASYHPLPVNQGGTGQTSFYPKYRFVNGTVANKYGATVAVCQTDLPPNHLYVVFGTISASTSNQNVMMNCNIIGVSYSMEARTVRGANGGVANWAIVLPSSSTKTIKLATWGYDNASFDYSGYMLIMQYPSAITF